MKSLRSSLAAACALFAFGSALASAQSFGFGSADSADAEKTAEAAQPAAAAPESGLGAKVSGSVDFSGTGFLTDLRNDAGSSSLSNGSTGRLNFEAKGGKAEAAFKLKVSQDILSNDPSKLIDEAYVRLFTGPLEIEGGLLKVTWGKADSQSVLDVLNPFDLTDLTVTDTRERKIARPMLHVSAALGSASKLEAAVLPSFAPNSVAWEGKWMAKQIGTYKTMLGITDIDNATTVISFPNTDTLSYTQAGARFTATFGSVDLGAQYFYGYLPTLAVSPQAVGQFLYIRDTLHLTPSAITVFYNRYHQAGVDAAAELFGLNLRAEAGANVTEDTAGSDPNVYNPTFVWNLGFDRDLFWGINLNVLGYGSVRLMDDKITSAYDLEKGTDATKTKIVAALTQKLFKDTVEWKLAGIYGIEDKDFFIYPSIGYIVGDARIDLTVGIFGGDSSGELGQFADSSYVTLALSYTF